MFNSQFIISSLKLILISLVFASCASEPQTSHQNADDAYLYLEQIKTPEALAWVKEQNKKSEKIQKSPRYSEIYQDIHQILVAKDRVPLPGRIANGWIYNFWQDSTHHKGIWRRSQAKSYASRTPSWQTLLDLDALAKKENESWVWKGATCLPPENRLCLIRLSRGGKDAVSIREFDVKSTQFVKDGFQLPEAKSNVNWMDRDTLWVGTDFGHGSLTQSGYPRILKLWKRGTALKEAKTIFEGNQNGTTDDMNVDGYTAFSAHASPIHIVSRFLSFFESEQYLYSPETQKLHKIQIPINADFKGVFQNYALAVLRTDWEKAEPRILAGTLIAIPIHEIESDSTKLTLETVYSPGNRSTIQEVAWSADAIYLDTLENVNGRMIKATRGKDLWNRQTLNFPDKGSVNLLASDGFEKDIYASYEDFLTPSSLYHYSGSGLSVRVLKRLPARFNADHLVIEQKEAKSPDGTRVPYFLVHQKNIKLDGKNPTLLYGYGGFEISMTPSYMNATGKVWLKKGGVYALANIRGGGEFGPKWHEAAILENRQRAYDDFISVAEDLIHSQITTPAHLGIMGGSNGGLLMGVMFTERPDLFKAVVCQVPLLDMLRYTKLPTGAGTSWIAEYGNPDSDPMHTVLEKYSPFQNVRAGVNYPRVYFESSTEDDRVSPAHARKMAAKMQDQGHEVIYFENTEGGHSAAADIEQHARRSAMEFTYLWDELEPKHP